MKRKLLTQPKYFFYDNRDNIALESIYLERLGNRRSVKYGKKNTRSVNNKSEGELFGRQIKRKVLIQPKLQIIINN